MSDFLTGKTPSGNKVNTTLFTVDSSGYPQNIELAMFKWSGGSTLGVGGIPVMMFRWDRIKEFIIYTSNPAVILSKSVW